MPGRPLTTNELLNRCIKDLDNLRVQFDLNQKNLKALIKQYEQELKESGK